jgi:hypothetical protein
MTQFQMDKPGNGDLSHARIDGSKTKSPNSYRYTGRDPGPCESV